QNKPDGLVYINHIVYAYKGTISENTSIVLTGGTISIAPAAFYYCIGLTSISIPSSVTSVGFDAFSDCYNLTTAKFNNPTGWFVADSADATSGTPVTVTSEFTEENANVLKGINGLYLLRRDA
ncbi:MAG: leucine-rich repeat protein, partial [Clostridia bacterium]|nr:leucine-rich repeat protein [Clostridia bacterium]